MAVPVVSPVVPPEPVQNPAAVRKGEHARYEDFPEIKLTEEEQQDFETRLLVVSGSITDPEKQELIKQTMLLWGIKNVSLFLSDRPFRKLKDGDELATFDNLTPE